MSKLLILLRLFKNEICNYVQKYYNYVPKTASHVILTLRLPFLKPK